jgi:YD repeat-containing protein
MKLTYLLTIFLVLTLAIACKDKAYVFYNQTDVAKHGLKGKVRSVVAYRCSLDSSSQDCSVMRRKYNQQGLITETIDTSGDLTMTYRYFYNRDGLLVKQVFTSKFIVPLELGGYIAPWEETYTYSIPERKRIAIFREDAQGKISTDTTITLYDKNGNEIQRSCRSFKGFKEYDEHGFLVSEWTIFYSHPQDTSTVRYVNDSKGRPLKVTRSDGTTHTLVYNKEGNHIQGTSFDSSGKKDGGGYKGYCEFDEKGNCLKSISISPRSKAMTLDSMIIEYY